jgi:hypothetical protein
MHEYDIALSFAGEDRNIASEIAQKLQSKEIKVFYDNFEQANLWGKDLYEYLTDVYSKHARYCVMILSASYERKLWTNHERQSAQERAFSERREYILPVRLDGTRIPGIRDTVGYIDLRNTSLDELLDMIIVKLGKDQQVSSNSSTQATAATLNIPLPKIKKSFTQLEKDRFLKDVFAFTMDFFRQGVKTLSNMGNAIDAEFTEVGPLKFTAKVYRNGQAASQCKIWMGGGHSSGSIYFSESFHDIHSDNSYNDWLAVEDDGFDLYFKASNMGFHRDDLSDKPLDRQLAAQYLWQRFIGPLER